MPRPFVVLFIVSALAISASRIQAGVIDSINASATPGSNSITTVLWEAPGNDAGWDYTPAFSYTLNGIATDFGASNQSLVTPTITVQIQTARPVNGGTLLAQGTFQGNSQVGGVEGASFSPIQLKAGTTYFIDLMNFNGMGINYGSWQQVSGQDEPSNGATVNLNDWFEDSATSTGFPLEGAGGNYSMVTLNNGSTVDVSPSEPIFLFSGSIPPVPEPSSILLAALGGAAMVVMLRRRKKIAGR